MADAEDATTSPDEVPDTFRPSPPDGGAPFSREAATNARRRMRRQLIGAVVVAVLSTAAAVGSILGQGIAYRQMQAVESIARSISEGCRR